MIKSLKYSALGIALLSSSLFSLSSYGESMNVAPITIEAPMISYPATGSYTPADDMTSAPYTDSADYLRSVPGITAGRFGGHGLEPVIRGQAQNQLNIVSDNAYVFGGCPNRMDPPTAYINIQPHDEITVVRGYQSVLNGFGGSGGSIIVEQGKPDLNDTFSASGLVQSGYDSNSQMWNAGGNVTAGTSEGYAEAYGAYKDAENYDDGDGDTVHASFKERSGGLKLGYTPQDTHYYAGIDYHKIDDALFPGAGMDSPYSEGHTLKAGMERQINGTTVQTLALNGYTSLVDHQMDNFSLRPLTAPMALRVDSESDTYGLKLESALILGDRPVDALLEWRRNNRDANRFVQNTNALQSLLWPDITIDEIGLAAETIYDLAAKDRLIIGGRYGYVHANFGRANIQAPAAANRTPNDIYNQFYGITASDKTEHHLNGLLRIEHDYSPNTMLYAGLSRSSRTADATERGLANFMGAGGASSWVGNPGIDPEHHHQIDAGLDMDAGGWNFGGSIYANYVQDYILRDSARTQPGILVDLPNADIYRNIDAILTGAELHGAFQIAPDWQFEGDATYTLGDDIDTGRALPQIPPLQGKAKLLWQSLETLELSTTMRWAFEQSRVDTDPTAGTGRDIGQTNGYAVFDIEGTFIEFEPATVNFGITNLFDTSYANHINRSNISDPTEVRVEEPGRSFYVQLSMPF
ncbi:MAG: TonB-dependent receptor [Rhodospirillales bacterium]|nr:TonB-dependent receptor [Rhodospirillales bacterium]MCB9996355.1 TonB-dependent receptor [Rhodospirillales bacterium]